MVAQMENSIHQMLSAMIVHAQNTMNQKLQAPKNAFRRLINVMVNQNSLRKIHGMMMVILIA